MDAFETVVGEILWRQGYWIQRSVKVDLTREDKIAIARHSSPRWELDVVGYNVGKNEILVVECKSLLDSPGVRAAALLSDSDRASRRYKLFRDAKLREIVFNRLKTQLCASGACAPDAELRLALAAGHVASPADRSRLMAHFEAQGWRFFDETWLRQSLEEMARGSYENEISSVVAKLIIRNASVGPRPASG